MVNLASWYEPDRSSLYARRPALLRRLPAARLPFAVWPSATLLGLAASLSLTFGLGIPDASADPARDNPYGVCAHLLGSEYQGSEQSLGLMQSAGVGWARADFAWAGVQPRAGEWDFARPDALLQSAEAAQVRLLPILDYDVSWAKPAHQHLDSWREYVRRLVGRYKDRLNAWEVWNEPNAAPFWYGDPDPAEYAKLLKATYGEIKALDQDLTVVLGGLSGLPLAYISALYEAGAGGHFDVMNVHPYQGQRRPEAGDLYGRLRELRGLMAENGDQDTPIWITELGWATHNDPTIVGALLRGVIQSGLAAIDPRREAWRPALLDDPSYPDRIRDEAEERLRLALQPEQVSKIQLRDVGALTPGQHGLLVMPPTERFPAAAFDDLLRYVRDGGVILFWNSVPLYYTLTQTADGTWAQGPGGERYRRALRLGWDAYWTGEGIPSQTSGLVPAAGWQTPFPFPGKVPKANRFLNGRLLESGDRFVPLVDGVNGDFKGAVAAAYAYDSDLKGGVIALTVPRLATGVTPQRQSQLLPRAYLIALQAGVERVFWYEFQSNENNPFHNEDHFGILHRDLSPKRAYDAMSTLARARPAGSAVLAERPWRDEETGAYFPAWERPDGRKGWALWQEEGTRRYRLTTAGAVVEAYDHVGQPRVLGLSQGSGELQLTESVLYVIGPDDIRLDGAERLPAPIDLRIEEAP